MEGNCTSLSLDLFDQWTYMEKTTQWRFTSPTHIVAAFHQALLQFVAEGGQTARLARYQKNYETLMAGMAELGLKQFLDPKIQAPIIVTVHAPASDNYEFKRFYNQVRDKGYVLYPGKLTQAETFRVGCIGAIGATRCARQYMPWRMPCGKWASAPRRPRHRRRKPQRTRSEPDLHAKRAQ